MSQGILILAQNNEDKAQDYLFSAWMCAKLIKKYNPDLNVSILTKDINFVPGDHKDVYDQIIEYPFDSADYKTGDISSNSLVNSYQLYYGTPYEQTLVLDADTLVIGSLTGLFEATRRHDILFPHHTLDFRGVEHRVNNKLSDKNALPQFATDIWYFTKNFNKKKNYRYEGSKRFELDTSEEDSEPFFNLLEMYLRNYKEVNAQIEHNPPAGFDRNFLFSLAIDNLNLIDEINDYGTLMYTDLTSFDTDWYKNLNYWIFENKLKIENYNVTGIIHYGNNAFTYEELTRLTN